MVLEANDRATLRTCCLRIVSIYGERDNQTIPGIIKVLHEKRHKLQIGNNTEVMDFLSASNAARAHLLACTALLNGFKDGNSPKVNGEASFITNGLAGQYYSGPSVAKYGLRQEIKRSPKRYGFFLLGSCWDLPFAPSGSTGLLHLGVKCPN